MLILQRMLTLFLAAMLSLTVVAGCKQSVVQKNTITLATTTSTQDSGLLDVLIPKFCENSGIDVKVVAVGSGQALELGRRGDADVLLTHAPAAEQKFMDEGWGQERRPVMYNDFALVGPDSDPARVKAQESVTDAFNQIADRAALFVSRGDESGTHVKEKDIWRKAGRQPEGPWYIIAGSGMAEVLRMANEKRAYTLADRGTFLALRKDFELEILSQRDPFLQNDYTVIVTSSKKHPQVNAAGAEMFANFLTNPTAKQLIAEFGVEKFSEPLFFPVK